MGWVGVCSCCHHPAAAWLASPPTGLATHPHIDPNVVSHPPAAPVLLQVAEFESDSFVVEDQEIIMNLVSYPTVCVRREFLDQAVTALLRQATPPRASC